MSTSYRYQQEFALDLTFAWLDGKRDYVRTTIRTLKNKAQAAYIAAQVTSNLAEQFRDAVDGPFRHAAEAFAEYMHPNNR